MTDSDRKKQILDHLARSSDGIKLGLPKRSSEPTTSPPTPAPAPKTDSRKQNIMAHLERSGGNVKAFSSSSQQRKSQILNHLRQSRG